jgi:hypothetical protein
MDKCNEIDINCKEILNISGIKFEYLLELNDKEIERDILLDQNKYEIVKSKLKLLKTVLNSNNLTCLYENIDIKQRWPLLNLVRQILKYYKYSMIPVRKCDGYTLDGIKKFKRYFIIKKQL